MTYKRLAVILLILTGLTVVLHFLTVPLPTGFALLLAFSAVPIYLITRLLPVCGPIAYWIAGLVILWFHPQSSYYFIFVHGPLGVALGVGPLYSDDTRVVALVSGGVVTLNLGIIQFLLQINIWGIVTPGPQIMQFALVTVAAFFYCFLFRSGGEYLLRQLSVRLNLVTETAPG